MQIRTSVANEVAVRKVGLVPQLLDKLNSESLEVNNNFKAQEGKRWKSFVIIAPRRPYPPLPTLVQI